MFRNKSLSGQNIQLRGYEMPIIVVCSNLADVVDTDSGWCKEVEE